MTAFKVVVQVNMGAEVMRSLALSITYSLHKGNPLKPLKGKRSTTSLRPATTPNGDNRPTSSASHQSSIFETNRENAQNIGLLLLEVYASWLCDDPSNTTIIKKFARTVTNKVSSVQLYVFSNMDQWLLYLLAENDQRVVLLAIRILSRLLVVHGSSYITKFAQPSNGGFTIMRNRLKRWWHTTTSWWVCFGILFGVDTAKIDMTQSFNKDNLISVFLPNGKLQIVYPEIFVVIGTMLKAGVSAVVVEGGIPKPSKYGIHESGALSLPNVSRLRSKSVNEAGGKWSIWPGRLFLIGCR
jgi:beige protein homolog 1